ncbi:cation:proton antiporter [Allochromatium palmeri]|uniref:Sodium:proton antiporter n=1 Tax=Allochromatium palmeri TaxID=231048 RepID=A0A6N8EDE8_9GAMM|nr:sodium:proton antiporter [Allochromatium palmeri]MTW20354.1 sodium:proton antiporter [Allochromatium palmeri]
MHLFDILAVLLSLAAAFSWINHRFIRLPTTIGLMLIALLLSLGLLIAPLDAEWHSTLKLLLEEVDFEDTVLHGMLGFLLFAGALHVDLHDLARHKGVIAILASASVIVATLLIGMGAWLLFWLLGLDVPFIYCLLFGALISPTDPIAVLGILKGAGAPESLNTKITGESLFNDGVAVVLFLTLVGIATGAHQASLFNALGMLGYEVIGGALLGFLSGGLVLLMLRHVDDYQVEILLTLALATGGYALADQLHLSAPIAIVVAGLMIGNHGRQRAMSETTRQHLDDFWELVDEILNAVLFVLIGLEVLVLDLSGGPLIAGTLAIPLVLAARALSVGLPIGLMRRMRDFAPGTVTLLTWAGLRGGISIALALSLPDGETRDILVSVTYVVVVFSILVQGLTLGPLVRVIGRRADRELAEVTADADSSAFTHN